MEKFKRIFWAIIITLSLMQLSSCQTYQEKRQAARDRYNKATAKAKIPVARDMFENNRLDDALTAINECLQGDKESPEANMLMGEIQFAMGKMPEAQKYFLIAIEYEPNLDKAWYYLGVTSIEAKKPEEALEYQLKALDIKPLNIDYAMAAAETYSMLGRYKEAEVLLTEKSSQMPSNSRLTVSIADIKHRQGDVAGATDTYKKALMSDPDNLDIMESLGYCYITREMWSEALEVFETLVQKSTGSQRASYLQMVTLSSMNSGQYGKAVHYYDQLSVTNRDDAKLWLQMGQAALGANSSGRALACADRALSLQPGWDEAIALKGCALYLKLSYNEAVNEFQQITGSHKMGGFAWLMTGRCYQQLGQISLAEKAYENAVKKDPDSKLVSILTQSEK